MPATPTNATTSADASLTSAPTLSVTTTRVLHPVLTTTVTSGGSAPLSTGVAALSHPSASDVPIAAIAGGAAAGVALAVVVVVGWTCWGKSIKRKKAKEVREALAVLEVRENTRKNASSLSHPATQYRPTYSFRNQQQRKVTFIPTGTGSPASNQSTLKGTLDSEKLGGDSEKKTRQDAPAPRPSTPSATQGNLNKPEPALPPPVPRRNPSRGRAPVESTVSNAPSAFSHRLVHQPSTLSSGSVYSTQSAIEERQTTGVPSSLLLALGNEDIRRSLLANYLPWSRHRNSTVSQNRLSEYSTGSVYSQIGEQPWEPVGYAYGDEEELMRH